MRSVSALTLILLAIFTASARADWVAQSDAITMEVLRAQGQFQPESLAAYGLSEFDEGAYDLSEGHLQRRLAENRRLVADLQAKLGKETHPRVRQDIELLIHSLKAENHSAEVNRAYLVPYLSLHQMLYSSFRALLDPRNDKSRYPAALVRLRKYTGQAAGYEPVAVLAIADAERYLENPALLGPYVQELQRDLDNAPRYTAGLRSLFEASGLEGWQQSLALLDQQLEAFTAWQKQVLLPRARQDSRLPEAVYADNLKNFGVDATPQELIDAALYSYQFIRSEMKVLARRIAEQREWQDGELLAVIRRLKLEQLPAEEVLAVYQQRLAAIEEIIRREDLITLPQRPASVRLATEAESAAIPASFMSPPQLINNTGQYGEFVLVQSNPSLGDDAQMDDFSHAGMTWALAVHEARPGHELQFARLVEDGTSLARAVYAANSANMEGWGLYAESIMQEYLPLEAQLFSLYMRLFRAARMFLDPMVNTGRITRDEARDFLIEHLAMSVPMASSEADRYTFLMPGQATAYYYGYMSMMALRTEVEIALGDAFDQKAFHDYVLQQGLLPPYLLRDAVLVHFANN